MSEASASSSSSNASEAAQHRDPDEAADRDPVALPPPHGLVLLWPKESDDAGSVLSDYE